MIFRYHALFSVFLLASSVPGHAAKWRIDSQDPVSISADQTSATGQAYQPGALTTDLLALQSQGHAASTLPQAMIQEVRDKVGERYLKTHDRLIPETFYGTTFGNKK